MHFEFRCNKNVVRNCLLLVLLAYCDNVNSQCNNGTINELSVDRETADQIETLVGVTNNSIKFSLTEPELYEYVNITCKSVTTTASSQVIVADSDHICQKLEPCTTYLVLLVIKAKTNNETVKEMSCEIETFYSEPSIEKIKAEPFTEEISLYWKSHDESCILKIEVEAKAVDKVYKWTLGKEIENLTMNELQPCQKYDIELKAFDIEQKLVSHLTVNTSTTFADPGDIVLNFTIHESVFIKVEWEPPKYASCINMYGLLWSMRGCKQDLDQQMKGDLEVSVNNDLQCTHTKNITEPGTTEYVMDNLQGCEVYDFEIYINNNSEPKAVSEFESPFQDPGQIKEVTITPYAKGVEIAWHKPEEHPNCVVKYHVQVIGPMQYSIPSICNNEVNEGNSVIVKDLEPCGHYNLNITVSSRTRNDGPSWNTTFEMAPKKPSKVLHIEVTPYAHAIDISWNPSSYGSLCIDNYRLSGFDDNNKPVPELDQTTQNTSIHIKKLYACQAYTVQIVPVTKNASIEGYPAEVQIQTAAVRPAVPAMEVISIDSHRIIFTAQESDTNNKCEGLFARFICQTRADARIKMAEKYVGSHLGILYDAELFPLSPYTEYACSVSIYNVAGWSKNKTIIKTTELYYPEPPESVHLKFRTNSSLEFSWMAPRYSNGIIKIYITRLKRVEAAFFIPKGCDVIQSEMTIRETTSLDLNFNDLLPFTRYSFQVAASNEYGISHYTNSYIVITNPWISEPISNLKLSPEGPYESIVEYKANVLLTWEYPCRSNGIIEEFILVFHGERLGYENSHFIRFLKPNLTEHGVVLYNETKLQPEYNYTVSIAVKTRNVDKLSLAVQDCFESPSGIPQRVSSEIVGKFRVHSEKDRNPAKIVAVRIPVDILWTKSGAIIYLALLLSEKNCNNEPQLKFGALKTNVEWPDSQSWNEIFDTKNLECIPQYQTTPLRWEPIVSDRIRTESSGMIEFIIGTEDCTNTNNRYCNGPLQPDTKYDLVVRLFTKSGYNDVAVLEFQTEALIDLVTIVVSVASFFVFAFVAGLFYFWITKRIKWQRESCHGIEDSFGDTVPKNFFIYYNEISRPEKLAREFKDLSVVASDLSFSAAEIGYHKNRYADIYPYDKNRVILDIDADGSDYINASFIDGYRYRKEYVATQGPKVESTKDFWRMVLQYNIRIIVMVTQFREGDSIKCYKYFPFSLNGIEVTIKKTDTFDLYDRTELSVTHETFGLKQKVVHFYFKKWPDHGCPTDPMHLINFIRKVKAEKIPNYSPTIVHCSAGVGRTGTFIALDIIMQRLKNESKINIYETVKKLRFQRMKMVQTLAQYTYLYTCVYELVKTKYNCPSPSQTIDGHRMWPLKRRVEKRNNTSEEIQH